MDGAAAKASQSWYLSAPASKKRKCLSLCAWQAHGMALWHGDSKAAGEKVSFWQREESNINKPQHLSSRMA